MWALCFPPAMNWFQQPFPTTTLMEMEKRLPRTMTLLKLSILLRSSLAAASADPGSVNLTSMESPEKVRVEPP